MNPSYAELHLNSLRLVEKVEQLMFKEVQENEASVYHLECGGGRKRAEICLAACQALSVDDINGLCMAACVELLHNASLIHDDLQDGDATRRGVDAVWKRYGSEMAICAGDLLIVKAFGIMARINIPQLLPILLNETQRAVSKTIKGQCADIKKPKCDSLSAYEDVAADKSGPLFQLCLSLPLIASDNSIYLPTANEALRRFAVAYQIADDLSDWQKDDIDKQHNVIHVLATESSIPKAIEIARTRSLYLLKSCRNKLLLLPQNCGNCADKVAANLYHQVSSNS